MWHQVVILKVLGGNQNMQIRKVIGSRNFHIVNIPPEYIKALGLKFGDYLELYLVNKLCLVIKKYNNKPPYGLQRIANSPPDDEQQTD